jgi:putative ABC transport system ATP-binding protein
MPLSRLPRLPRLPRMARMPRRKCRAAPGNGRGQSALLRRKRLPKLNERESVHSRQPGPPGPPDSPGSPGTPLVRLRGVRKAYDDGRTRHEVLAGVDLEVHAGELVALLGPSGSGKSTLLNVIAGIDTPDAGTVELSGRDVTQLGERDRTLLRRSDIGFVFQFFNLVPTLTVSENVQLPLELTGWPRRDLRTESHAALERVGITGRDGAFPEELSGGEQQRVAIARALAHGPRLVLADEPTGNLDTATGARILELLTGLIAERGTAMLIATHSMEVVERAHRVITLRDGVIVADA